MDRCAWTHTRIRQGEGVRCEAGDVGVVGEMAGQSADPCFSLAPAEGPPPVFAASGTQAKAGAPQAH
jgi:hypothetical protein